ncbi:hypothetical protein SteCoe_31314 [Stentor coeruleus]|uniref:Uncharacterized protein n=1 Tax=Stentor coeruleus TaxID=5963 RepID=A0A1R2B1J7_9CILI|nr:hypothetical protein SteCoe_31314 [Stentor coeruleus]
MSDSQENNLSTSLNGFKSFAVFSPPQTQIVVPQFISNLSKSSAAINKPISTLLGQELSNLLVNLEKKIDAEKTDKIIEKMKATNKCKLVSNITLIEHLCYPYQKQPFKLIFHTDIPHPAYKGKCFTLRGNIIDRNNNIVILDEPIQFRAVIYNAEHPIKTIDLTRYNEKIIKGNTVIETLSNIYFRKLMIMEVSSYHPSKMFNLVILADDMNKVEPFVFSKLVVKWTKLNPYEIRKKFKFDEFYNFLGNLK